MEEKNNLYDKSIKIDISNFPKIVKEYIARLEHYDEIDDELNYLLELDNFDAMLKSVVLNGGLSEKMYYKLMYKYGGEYDE